MAVISIDVGTTVTKAVGYDDSGAERFVARRPATVSRLRPGWAEQDMAAVWSDVCSVVREVVASLGDRDGRDDQGHTVDLVTVTAQGDGLWLVDRAGAPTGPALLWNDGRASAFVEQWRDQGVLAKAFRINGSLGFAGLPHAQLRWLQQHDHDRLDRSDAALTCGGWVFLQMTGRQVMDPSDASAPFLDLLSGRVSDELVGLFGLGGSRRLLQEPGSDEDRVAPLTEGAAAAMGLPTGTPAVLSAYDIASTAIGAGAVSPGQACTILGTTLCAEVVTGAPAPGGEPSGLTVAMGLPGRWLRAFPTLAGGEVVGWAQRTLGLDDLEHVGRLSSTVAPGAGGLAFLPYLSPAGERAPFLDPLARGSLLGLTVEHGREHVSRAVLEGLTYVVRDCLAAAGETPRELRVCGGGAASAAWLQMIADVTGVPVLRSRDSEVGARGAMLLGLVLTGRAESAEDAASAHVSPAAVFLPDPARSAAYDDLYGHFLALRDIALTAGPRLAAMRDTDARENAAP